MGNDMPRCVWPEWEFVRRIGRGAYGTVYEAVRTDDYGVESRAAIKVVSIPQDEAELDSLRTDGMDYNASKTYMRQIVDSFVNEVKLMIQLKGAPNIVSVEDYKVVERPDEIGWDISIRMELLTPLATYISDKAVTEKEVAKIGCDICAALEICENKNIIHRDIKPANIFVNEFGDFKLGDFGIAKQMESLTMDLSRKGTGAYMAPEVERGASYNATVDLYSLGLVLYYLLNRKRLPFNDPDKQLLTPNERERAIRRRLDGETLPAPCDASPEMTGVIRCACAYNPRQRFRSAKAMQNALQLLIKGEVDFSEPKKPVESDLSGGPEKRKGTRRKIILPVTIIVVVAAVVVILFFTPLRSLLFHEEHNPTPDPSDGAKTTVEYTTEMQHASAKDSKGNIVVSADYELVVLEGDDGVNRKINAGLEQDCQEFLDDYVNSVDEETIENYSADNMQQGTTAEADVVYDKNEVLSILYEVQNENPATTHSYAYGLTYSLGTGDQMRITDLTDESDAEVLEEMQEALRDDQSTGYLTGTEAQIDDLTLNDIDNEDNGLGLHFIVEGGEIVLVVTDGEFLPYGSGFLKVPIGVYIDTMSYDEYTADYIFPDSSSRYLTREDLEGLSKEELRLARNEIFARHGRLYRDENLNAYFSGRSWYHGIAYEEAFDESVFNDYEWENLETLNNYEKEMGYQ